MANAPGQKRPFQGDWGFDGKRVKAEGEGGGFFGNDQWQQGPYSAGTGGGADNSFASDSFSYGNDGWGAGAPPNPQAMDFTHDDYNGFYTGPPMRGPGRGGFRGRGFRGGPRGGQQIPGPGAGPMEGPYGPYGPGPRGGRGRIGPDGYPIPQKPKPVYENLESMTLAEKLGHLAEFLKNDDSPKINAIQTITNGIMSSKLGLNIHYAAEELSKVGGNAMFTGVLKIDDTFLVRGIGPNKKELKQDVFRKALDLIYEKPGEELVDIKDPGIEAVRNEFEQQTSVKLAKGLPTTPEKKSGDCTTDGSTPIVLQDVAEALKKLNDTINNMKATPISPISVFEQGMNMSHCVIRHQFVVEATKLPNGRFFYQGKLIFGSLVLGRGHAMTKKTCKNDTYKKTLERLKETPMEELKEDCPPEKYKELEFGHHMNNSQNAAMKNLPIEERLGGMIKSLDNIPGRESNINPIDIAAMSNGLTPMVIVMVLPTQTKDDRFMMRCELYLDKIQIATYEGIKKHECVVQTYNNAVEVLKSSSIETILAQHKRITDEYLKDPHIMDIFIKGSGRMIESNSSGLRRYNCDLSKLAQHRCQDLVLIEHKCWARDRPRNAFCILQFSCTHNGMLLQWETKTIDNNYLCVMTVQKEEVGRSYGSTRVNARNKAATDALFHLYETQPVITMSIVDDSNKWVPWETIKAEADKLRQENVGEEPIMKNDEKGNPLPDAFVVKAVQNRMQEFNDGGRKMEFTIGPGMGPAEYRHMRFLAREMELKFDGRQHNGEPYPAFFEKRTWPEIVQVLKQNNGLYGKFILLGKEELPKHEDIESMVTHELVTSDNPVAEVEMKEEEKEN